MKITVEPRSDQWNADDFIGGPRTFTIAGVKVGSAEQKYDVELVEGEGRVWRPPLTVLRLLVAAWGDEAQAWQGKRVTLYRDTSIKFGSDAVGGIRVSHMSDLPGNKPFGVKVTISRGKRAFVSADPIVVDPADELARVKKSLWSIAKTANPDADQQTVMAWLNEQAATHSKALDSVDDVTELVRILTEAGQ